MKGASVTRKWAATLRVLASFADPSTTSFGTRSRPLVEIPPEVQDCVAFLGFDPSSQDGNEDLIEVCGTAFFLVRRSAVRPGGAHLYLVTAKHVIADVAHKQRFNIFVRGQG
jgi:hypothetical protein